MSTAMMAITTNSSMSVKPRRRAVVKNRGIAAPRWFSVSGTLTLRDFAQGRQVPDLDRMVAASRDQPSAVGAEPQAADDAGVASEAADQLSSRTVCDVHGAVLTRRGDPPALLVGAERQGVALAAMPPQGLKFHAVLQVPDLARVPLTPRRQPPAVRAEGHVQTRPRDP